MSQPIRVHGRHLVFPIGPKNTSLVDDSEVLRPVKFRSIPFSCSKGEVEIYQPIRVQRGNLFFSDRPKKHKLGR